MTCLEARGREAQRSVTKGKRGELIIMKKQSRELFCAIVGMGGGCTCVRGSQLTPQIGCGQQHEPELSVANQGLEE